MQLRKTLTALLLCLIAAAAAFAQFDTAAVLGTVRDTDGTAIPEVVVELRNTATGRVLTTRTDASGSYIFLSVPIGRYQATTAKPEFLQGESELFDLTVNARQRVDFEMYPATAQATTVEVTGEASLVESDSSDRGQVVNTKQIVELPLNGRAYSELNYLAPGIVPSPSAGDEFNDREGSFVANGLRSVFNNYLLDGLDNNYYGTSNQGFSNQVTQLPPDAVAEFRVVANNMSAEYGRAGGATVNVAMRGGTNQFHGSAWEFLRNTDLNAVGFFKPASGEKPQLNRNQFGFTLGGPVLVPHAYNGKNRSFFFFNYEGFREVQSQVEFATLPTEQQRQGVLGVPVLDVVTGTPYVTGQVPREAMTPFARAVLDALPPNTSPGAANNYQRLARIQNFRDKGDAKVDHNFTDSVRMFAHYSQSRADIFDPGLIPGLAGGNGNGTVQIPVIRAAGGATWILGPATILEGRFGFSRALSGKKPPMAGGPSMFEMFGIPGLPTDPQYTGGISYQALVGYTPLGRQFTSPQYQHPWVYNPKANFTRILGRQTIKAGAEIQWVNVKQQDIHPVYGLDAYQGLFSGAVLQAVAGIPQNPAATPQYSLADFMFGQRAVYVLASPSIANIRQRMFFGYLQDDIRVTPKLTLNLGLRYEFSTPMMERDNRLSNFNPETLAIDVAKDGSLADRGLVEPDTNNLGPRVGLAYSLTPKTVLRTGYGVSYIHWNRLGSSYLTLSPPFAIVSTQLSIPGQPGFRPTQFGYPEDYVTPEGLDTKRSLVQHMPKDSPSGRVQSWFFSIQRELGRDVLLDIAYVGNESNNLQLINDINQAAPGSPAQLIPVEFRRPIPAYSSIPGIMPWGFSNYHGLQAKIEKRFGGGLYLLNSFTFSKAIDNANQALDNGPGGDQNPPSVQNIYDLDADRALSDYHRKYVNSTSIVWEVPVGRGRPFGAGLGGAANAILGGWQITAINQMRSGSPLTLVYVPGLGAEVSPVITVFGRNMYRPNITGNPLIPEGQRSPASYLDRGKVSIPPANQPFGNAGRNIITGPDFFHLDLGIYKNFSISEHINLQFRAESFNALNRTNFGAPDTNVSNQSFGQINSTFDPRQFQFGLKLQF